MQRGRLRENNCNTGISSKGLSKFVRLTPQIINNDENGCAVW